VETGVSGWPLLTGPLTRPRAKPRKRGFFAPALTVARKPRKRHRAQIPRQKPGRCPIAQPRTRAQAARAKPGTRHPTDRQRAAAQRHPRKPRRHHHPRIWGQKPGSCPLAQRGHSSPARRPFSGTRHTPGRHPPTPTGHVRPPTFTTPAPFTHALSHPSTSLHSRPHMHDSPRHRLSPPQHRFRPPHHHSDSVRAIAKSNQKHWFDCNKNHRIACPASRFAPEFAGGDRPIPLPTERENRHD